MVDSDSPSPDRLCEFLERGDDDNALACVERLASAPVQDRKGAIRSVRSLAADSPAALEPILPSLAAFLADDERAVRLTTAKLFVALAERMATLVVPFVSPLAERLGDDEEFYYVRARCAEALGYVALDHPDAVTSPDILADLRVGLSFDEPEVKVKLAKALEHVAHGNPRRLRHHCSSLAEHLDDDRVLVRYHLSTALVVVGCDSPQSIAGERAAFLERLGDENQYVRGRAAEALGALARASHDQSIPPDALVERLDDKAFVAERARFALRALGAAHVSGDVPDEVGSLDAIYERTADVVEDIVSPQGDGECPHCGLPLPENGPPMCPQCGTPH